MSTPKTDNSNERESAAQMVWETKSNGQECTSSTRYACVSEYTEGSCKGRWHWMVRDQDNFHLCTGGIADSENEAKTLAQKYFDAPIETIRNAAAHKLQKQYDELLEEMRRIDYKPNENNAHATGYDHGWKEAFDSMRSFIELKGH